MSAQPQASRAQPQASRARVEAFRATDPHRSGTRLRVLPIPETEPAPLHRAPLPACITGSSAYVQGELAVDFGVDAEGQGDGYFEPQATPTSCLPEAAGYADRLVRLVLETMDGTRPSRQLHHWVESSIHERLTEAGVLARRRRVRPRPHRVLAVRVCEPVDGVAEVAAVVRTGGRVRAMAMRLVGIDGRWVLTALEIG